MQLGVQHTDDKILRKINRGCTNADTERALRLLKDACYKADTRLMPSPLTLTLTLALALALTRARARSTST